MARSTRRSKTPSMGPLYTIIGIAVLALVVAALAAQQRAKDEKESQQASAPPQVEDNPFGDLAAPDAPRRKTEDDPFAAPKAKSTFRKETNRAPASILTEDVWVDAQRMAETADALLREAEAALKQGKDQLYTQKAVAGREILDQQLVKTADWEEQLLDEYNDTDKLVRQIQKERNRWFDVVKKYRKVGTHSDD